MILQTFLRLTREWGLKAALSIADQGLRSGANFLFNILLARWLSASEYGAFSVALVAFLFLAGFHSALLLEPMSVLGPASFKQKLPSYLSNLVWAHLGLTVAMALVTALSAALIEAPSLRLSILGLSFSIPCILLFWLLNRACYLEARSDRAVIASLTYAGTLLLLSFVFRRHAMLTAFTSFIIMAAASLAGALVNWWQLGIRFALPHGTNTDLQISEIFRVHWDYGKWMVGLAVLSIGTTYIQTFITAAVLGLEATGILRAMVNPVLPVAQTITAISLLALPILSDDFARLEVRNALRKGYLITIVLTILALFTELVLCVISNQLERLLYDGKFAEYTHLIPLLGLAPVFLGIASGYSLLMRAFQKPQHAFLCALLTAPASLVSTIVFIEFWGLDGAALSTVISYGFGAIIALLLFSAMRKPQHK